MDAASKQAMFARAQELRRRRRKAEEEERRVMAEHMGAPKIPSADRCRDAQFAMQRSESAAAWLARRQELRARRAACPPADDSQAPGQGEVSPNRTAGPVRPISQPSYERLLGAQASLFKGQQIFSSQLQVKVNPAAAAPRWS
jgi:hypothetical protein